MTREWRNTRRILAGLCVFAIAGGLVLWGWRQACKANYTRVREGLESKGARLSVAANLPVVDPGFANGGRIFLEHVGGIPKPPNYMGYVCMELIAPGRAMSAAGLGAIPYETESGAWTNLWDALPGHVEPGRGA